MELRVLLPGADAYQEINANLVAYNETQVDWETETLSVVIAGDGEAIVAGVHGVVRMGAVEVRGLWVDENFRGQGLAARILTRLEVEAARRGAGTALLDTYSFQARGFYERQGYRCFGTFDYPNGVQRVYMTKSLLE
ncbi:GNAT family N-acetyltransferase [Roseibium sp. RKSG952]|uniref:GNAT family N-acetyltransferase n=1 Tax=Roseibium sp. RKSG952 TaxID=2529384 RepID=UPI0018AD28AD|nr:GNAT family N-acetyltransferase [Roseibium sp. RKSG952]